MGQDVNLALAIKIDDHEIEVVNKFTYHGSNISENLSWDAEINRHIGKAALMLAHLVTCVWENDKLTAQTKIVVYNTCVISKLLYYSET